MFLQNQNKKHIFKNNLFKQVFHFSFLKTCQVSLFYKTLGVFAFQCFRNNFELEDKWEGKVRGRKRKKMKGISR